MSASLTISTQEFKRAAELCIQHTERTYSQFINGQGLAVASRAIKETEKTTGAAIEKQLWSLYGGAESAGEGVRIYRNQYGTFSRRASRWTKAGGATPMIYHLVNAARKSRGERGLAGAGMAKAARRLIGARKRSAAFIRSGWVYAVRTLASAVGYRSSVSGSTRMSGTPKGYAIPARPAINSVVMVELANTALLQERRSPMPVAQKGLAAAMQFVARDMLAHLAKKLQPELNAVSAK